MTFPLASELTLGLIWLIFHNMQEQNSPPNDGNRPVWTLGDLSQALKKTVESVYDQVRVKAEVSQPKRAASGHVYFTLKDDSATLDAVCWKGVAAQLATQPEEGLEVVVTGKLTTYPGRSKYQIVVQQVELAGEGALLKQLEERRRRLMAEGLFAPERKQKIPAMPRIIGVVTSPTGAVIRDILHRLKERYPVHVLVWPVLVQGQGAAEDIAAAIRGFDHLVDHPDPAIATPDTLIIARGGGSIEDLMAFNEEVVVRAVADCRLPVISAVGHETDTTLIDHAADLRAPTPTAAAEFATPVAAEIQARINDLETRMMQRMQQKFDQSTQQVRHLERVLADPGMLMETKGQRLDLAVTGLDRSTETILARLNDRFTRLGARLQTPSHQLSAAADRLRSVERRADLAVASSIEEARGRLSRVTEKLTPPAERITMANARLDLASQKLDSLITARLNHAGTRLDQSIRLLDASSFQRVLDRGFALVTTSAGAIMRSAGEHPDGTAVSLRFADGDRAASLGEKSSPPSSAQKPEPKAKPARPAGASKKDNPDQGNLF